MNILHVVHSYYPAVRYGGPIRSVANLCAGLRELGHSSTVCTTDSDSFGPVEVPLDGPAEVDGTTVHYFRCPGWHYSAFSPAMERWLKHNAGRFDLVHIHGVWTFPQRYAARAARRAGVPYVISPRGMADARIARKRLGISKWVYIRLYDRTNLAQANMIHYTAPGEQEHSLLKGRERATCVVPNPVEPLHVAADAGDADEGSPLPEGFLESDYILSVGRLAWTKGIDILIKAMGKLGEEYADVRLAVVGPDTENLQADLTALAAQEGVADRVFFLGTQKGTRLQRLYRSAKLVAAPALSEGFGNTVAEALLEGVPVVASDAVGLATFPEILEHIKVCDTGPASVGLAILLVLREQERWRESAAQACRVLKENFSARAVAARLVENYSGLRPGS